MAEDQDPLEGAPDPTDESDTPDGEPEDTAETDDSGQSDWTPKDRSEATRKITELAQENARLKREAGERKQQPDDADGDSDDSDDDYVLDQNALLAGELYGPEVVEAATAVWPLLENAQTTADYMAIFESYHEARSKGATPKQAAEGATEGQSREDAVQPRVDSNRSDRAPDSEQLAEARKAGNLGAYASAAIEQMFGRGKQG